MAGRGAALPRLESALELWSTVQSTPEPGLAILSCGKRDAPYDIELPVPRWSQRGTEARQGLSEGWRISRLNDQHAFLQYPSSATLEVGDRIGCGISHPCGAFDRWRCIPVVDAADIVRAVYHTVF
jgi:D-serine dehydratase